MDSLLTHGTPLHTPSTPLLETFSARPPTPPVLERIKKWFRPRLPALPLTEPSQLKPRLITPHMPDQYAPNAVLNAKYTPWLFLPLVLYEQFKFFFNLYFLLVALSQAVPVLRIGYLSSYVAPLAFVLCVTMLKEALDDVRRRRRDAEQNAEAYDVADRGTIRTAHAKNLRVGDIVVLSKGRRVPADMVLLQAENNEVFLKTDQLDGETDWKLRIAPSVCAGAPLAQLDSIHVTCEPPLKLIHAFQGRVTFRDEQQGLSVDNTLWANTVIASGSAVGIVVYTGPDTRQAMNTLKPTAKTGLLELEINLLLKLLCALVFVLLFGLVALHRFGRMWYVDVMKYLILFLTIIPVSLRVNLDLGKLVYAHQIEHDKDMEGAVVRTSTIPEDLGRIEYLLLDKTGTLTQNDMEMKKIHLGTVLYGPDLLDMVSEYVIQERESKGRRDMGLKVYDLVQAMSLCHNVTPNVDSGELTYQAASPDEIAIVKYTELAGLKLVRRDRHLMTLLLNERQQFGYDILHVFPFNSDLKRMGIVVFDKQKSEYWFFLKGADSVMKPLISHSIWLDEEVLNMAREGLRTLVFARKRLTESQYEKFKAQYHEALLLVVGRDSAMAGVVSRHLEHDMELLGLTGVEDKLQKNVKQLIELLRNAGVKIWMLTGDKVETARCVAISAKLVTRGQYIHTVTKATYENALEQIDYLRSNWGACLLIDGESLGVFLRSYKREFFEIAVHLPAVIACRCTPQQKADVAILIREETKKRVCCIGDGGNDVSMIQSADVGVGIVGKEGRQALLAADFLILQFCDLTKLLLWHGRNLYKRLAKLAQFVIHRGLIISVCQVVYSVSSLFEPLALYQGWLMVGYATLYTMMPVFLLVLDCDVNEKLAYLYPELYAELTLGRSLSWISFLTWCAILLYQGCVIQLFAQHFTSVASKDFLKMVALSFTTLIVNELLMVAIEINTWRKTMVVCEIVTFMLYFGSVPFLGEYFDLKFFGSVRFLWELIVIVAVSLVPIWAVRAGYRRLVPPNYAKVQ